MKLIKTLESEHLETNLREVLGGLIETEFGLDIMKALNK